MKITALSTLLAGFVLFSCNNEPKNSVPLTGVQETVEVLRDSFGINHIYAQNQHDLFFTQGYLAAKDRLFQFEIWRRQATGTLSEVFGTRTLKRDIGARLFKYRGDLSTELNHYHDDGEAIVNAYVDGVNAYIEEALSSPEDLPIEFKILNIKPVKWTPEVVISRHQGLLGNVTYELDFGRAVAAAGTEAVKDVMWFHPKEPDLTLDPGIDKELLAQDILELYDAFHSTLDFVVEDIDPAYRANQVSQRIIENIDPRANPEGSNNWVLSGSKTASGSPILANDPHRRIAVPSLRYAVHLVAPGWNVIGGGEPEIPGVSIGHNENGAWGLTVFDTDAEDLYVYDLNPDNLSQYKYKDAWVDMTHIEETITIENEKPHKADLYYTQHGPVTFIDSVRNKAFAVRCGWLEPGGAPYLASLRMDQAKTWEEYVDACSYSHIPGENMIWADTQGNIGWQAVGIAPIRPNFSGLVPVPGDGRYEWDGYLPIRQKPHLYNPDEDFIKTANENVTPEDYDHWDAIGFEWADPFRGNRISNVLKSKEKFELNEMTKLQTDYFSIPATYFVPLLESLEIEGEPATQAATRLKNWDYILSQNSIEAGIYVAWENKIKSEALKRFVNPAIQEFIYLQLTKVISWCENPDKRFGADPRAGRDKFLANCFQMAIEDLQRDLGPSPDNWVYGQLDYKHVYIKHAFDQYISDSLKSVLNAGPAVRGGYSYTVGSTGSSRNQSSGASFRIIMDLSDWDAAVGANPPGQSGDPRSPFYRNLFESWSKDQFIPFYYSREKVESTASQNYRLVPR